MRQVKDIAVRGLSKNGRLRGVACVTTGLVNELQRRHNTWPVATAALGRTASIAAMMGLELKNDERLTVQIKGDGPIKSITVDADGSGHVRGYVENPHVHLPSNPQGKLDVGGGVGAGMLYVIRDQGLKDYYRGSAELQSGEIADDFTYYFAVSEQTPSSVGAGVLVDTDNSVIVSGGFIVQLMPGHTEADISSLERQLAGLASVTDILKAGATASDLLEMVLPDAVALESQELEFRCTCSRQRLEAVLRSLGAAEIESMIQEQGGAQVTCHFCGEVYDFSGADLQVMLEQIDANGQEK
ncbi:Hsp33 family molecular chaperone HslO [Alicyclobacillus tolerans]|uniref:Hsp33 family molecular chaperone HslO n=1 Tax=Alicyclobacillus tolerans TaxID=90970 RepID=UPI001F02B3CF|nr:Hsp33 family molecular chaperone HslO [Alicyclobacillus tolerans]MCF8568249.1 Hsp33 family molecular chaperone HslO [Alicyclobacillus tolerans]